VERRILGVFAHPDDEVFCVGGTMAKYVQAGAEAMVVCATRGEAGQIRDASVATRSSVGAVREAELRDACVRLGIQHIALLDHIDGTLAGLDRRLLVDEVSGVIDDFSPNVVVTFGPDGAYGHPDHVTIGSVTSAACATWAKGRLYHSYFPRSRLLLVERLAEWLTALHDHFKGAANFARVFSLFAQESTALGYADDHIDVGWFPPGVSIVEQGEAAEALYLILSGAVEVTQIQPDGKRTTLRRSGPGEFFGEIAIAQHSTRTAQVTAVEAVTCLVFTRQAPALWGSRGAAEATGGIDPATTHGDSRQGATTVIDVRGVIDRKVAAIAAHRTQYPIEPEMIPRWMLEDMMGFEHFVRAQPPREPESDLFE
jgi:LmbE family N-acetylglucosaminyl deacetylase